MTLAGETITPRSTRHINLIGSAAIILIGLTAIVMVLAVILTTARDQHHKKFRVQVQEALYKDDMWVMSCFGDGQYPCIINAERSMMIVQVPQPLSYRISRPGMSVGESLIVGPCKKFRCDVAPEEQFGAILYTRAAYLFEQVAPISKQ